MSATVNMLPRAPRLGAGFSIFAPSMTLDETAAYEESRTVRRISIIAPMLNEAEHIESFVADVAAQDFAGDVVRVARGKNGRDRRLTTRASRSRSASVISSIERAFIRRIFSHWPARRWSVYGAERSQPVATGGK